MKNKNIWKYIAGITIIVIGVLKLDVLLNMISMVWNASKVLVFGGMLAFVINLVMVRIENKLDFVQQGRRTISLITSLIFISLFIYFLITLVFPSLMEAGKVLIRVCPEYFDSIQKYLADLFENNPQIYRFIVSLDIDWKNILQNSFSVITAGVTNVVGTTVSVVSVVVSSVFNFILMVIFAIYVLLEKERFERLYHRLTDLYLPENLKSDLDVALKIIYKTFGAFVGGQCIEATILGSLCALGMYILHMPYPIMVGTLVGFINIIPMIGAYIGGAIGMFMVFTVSPITSLWFLLYLCILQQIESNLIYPKVVGNSVGLPGIYVMMTVIVFGSLAGIAGMFLGIPAVASFYKIMKLYIDRKERQKRYEVV